MDDVEIVWIINIGPSCGDYSELETVTT